MNVKVLAIKGGFEVQTESRTLAVLRVTGECEIAPEISDAEKVEAFRPLMAAFSEMLVRVMAEHQGKVQVQNQMLLAKARLKLIK
jgi:hypothetical protein